MELCANTEALNGHLAKQQSGEEQLEEAQNLIACRLADCDIITIDNIRETIAEINSLDYGLDGRELVLEHLENVL